MEGPGFDEGAGSRNHEVAMAVCKHKLVIYEFIQDSFTLKSVDGLLPTALRRQPNFLQALCSPTGSGLRLEFSMPTSYPIGYGLLTIALIHQDHSCLSTFALIVSSQRMLFHMLLVQAPSCS